MDLFANFKWYNIVIIVLLVVITIVIILLPNDSKNVSNGLCTMTCPNQIRSEIQNEEKFEATGNVKIDNEPKNEIVLYYATWCHYS
jgi:hypothetical protein